jgi:phage tail sheath protein FI
MFDWWGNTFILTYFQKVDSPLNKRLIEAVVDSENIRANGFKARYQIADAYIEYSVAENPVTDLLNGKITFHQYLTPFPPAETIMNVLEFDPVALTTALA